jgi:hypothetical protein
LPPLKPDSQAFFFVLFNIMMIVEAAAVTLVVLMIMTWKWLKARMPAGDGDLRQLQR